MSVQIQHHYRGDLHVRLEMGTLDADGAWVAHFQYLLHDQIGEGARDLRRVYAIDMPGYDVSGSWRLVVEDRAEGDEGRLEGWELGFTIPSLMCQERIADNTEAAAADRGETAGCGIGQTSLYGALGGARDVDWHRIFAVNGCYDDDGATRLVDIAAPPTARLCIHAECLTVGASGPSFECEVGSPERSADGRPGCCGPVAGGGPALRLRCVPGQTALATYYVSVTDRSATGCTPYSFALAP